MTKPTVLSSLADRFAKGGTVVSAWCGLPDPSISAILAQEDFDAITLDMQHGPITLGEVIRAIPLINAAGKPAIARIPVGEFQNVSKLFDSGVSGVIAPMINTMEDARRFAAYAKALGDRFVGRVLPDVAANSEVPPFFARHVTTPHSDAALHLIDEAGQPTIAARDEILSFFKAR